MSEKLQDEKAGHVVAFPAATGANCSTLEEERAAIQAEADPHAADEHLAALHEANRKGDLAIKLLSERDRLYDEADKLHDQASRLLDHQDALLDGKTLAAIPRPGIRMVRAADVKEEKIEWLWRGRVPKRYATFLSGNPDLGKSHISVDLAARISVGGQWPDGQRCEEGAVLFLVSEDGLSDVLRPRLRIAGADLDRVGFIVGKFKAEQPEVAYIVNLTEDLAALEATLPAWEKTLGAPIRLLVIDPFLNHLGKVNPNKESDVRPLMAFVAGFLHRTGIALLGLRHLNKDETKSLIYRAGGSIAFSGAARSEYLVGPDPQDPSRMIFARVKGNLAAPLKGLAYQIVASDEDPDIAVVRWLGLVNTSAQEVAAPPDKEAGKRVQAKRLILDLLGEGRDMRAVDVYAEADKLGISNKTVLVASKEIGVRKRKDGIGGPWLWSLTDEEAQS